ncbi:MAG TPA: hypothetical protein VEF34_14055 [Syntrophobacteraceae bacterium]|nr:hypothetical protein [Syntrophobacteraceae bacterium]
MNHFFGKLVVNSPRKISWCAAPVKAMAGRKAIPAAIENGDAGSVEQAIKVHLDESKESCIRYGSPNGVER